MNGCFAMEFDKSTLTSQKPKAQSGYGTSVC